MVSHELFSRYYSDSSHDGTRAFYAWVRAHTSNDTTLLNLGAGAATGSEVRSLRGEVAWVVGADIDPIVLENDELDDAYVIQGETLPFEDESLDIVLSDFVLEHVERPLEFLQEVRRVLRRGGSFFFRTPNKFHYVALIARATPHWFHRLVANRVRGLPKNAHAPSRTFYRLSSQGAIRGLAKRLGFTSIELRMIEAEPSYLMFHPLPFLAGVAYERLVNRWRMLSGLRANIFGRLVK